MSIKCLNISTQKYPKVFDSHAPTIKKNIKGKPYKWMTRGLKKEMNNQDRQLRKVRKSNSEKDWSSYKRLRNHCNNQIRKAKTYQNLPTENETNPHQFWNVIKEIYLTKPKPVGSVTTNKKDSKSTILRFSYFFKAAKMCENQKVMNVLITTNSSQ